MVSRRTILARIISVALSIVLVAASMGVTSYAETVQDLEKKKQQAVDEKKQLEKESNQLYSDYRDVTSQYNDLKSKVDALDRSVEEASQELAYLSQQLSDAKVNQAKMEQIMKLHIKYMYENDAMNMLEMLLESGSISELFEKIEYLNIIVKYDRQIMDEYKKTQQDITAKTTQLSEKRASLEAQSNELSTQKQELKKLVDSAGAELSGKNAEVNNAQAEINAYDKRIAEMKQYERQLASTNAASQEALRRQIGNFDNTEDTSGAYSGYSQDDLYLLAAIIHAEAEGEPYEGKIAVGSVVMNRVFSSKFPNTISGVVYQKNQFEPASSGRLQLILDRGPNPDCFEAAREVLAGTRNTHRLFFWALWLAEQRGLIGNMEGEIIGTQFFF